MASAPTDWQLDCIELKQRGAYLLQTGQWSDCTFLVGTEPNQVVVVILAMASPVFEAMFYGGMAERNEPIPIVDVQIDAFRALLEYIYTGNINISSFDKACELCYGAKKYMLPHLVKECTRYLWSDLYPRNACKAYEFSRLFEENVLVEECIQITRNNQHKRQAKAMEKRNVENTTPPTEGSSVSVTRLKSPVPSTSQEKEQMLTFTVDTPSPVSVEQVWGELHPKPSRHDGVKLPPSIHNPVSGMSVMEHMERHSDGHKIYSQRAIVQHTDCLNTSALDCSVTFMVDKNICLLGVQVPTQAPNEETGVYAGAAAASGGGYSELLYAHLLDADGARLTYTHYTHPVPYRHLQDIMFNRPVYIQRNKVYKVAIVFNKVGWYPMGSCAQQVTAEGVFFNFLASATAATPYATD